MKLVSIFMTVLFPFLSQAGAISGGGGKGVVCRLSSGAIASVELLDLYEGRAMRGRQSPKSSEPMATQIDRALEKIPATSRALPKAFVGIVNGAFRLTPAGTDLVPIDDSFESIIPRDCKVEQLANYYSDQLVLVNGELWAAMGETDRAALIVHEALYAANRLQGAANSQASRNAVSAMFDPSTAWIDVQDGVPADALKCVSKTAPLFAWAFMDVGGSWRLQFYALGNGLVMSRKMTLPSPNLGIDLNEAKTFPVIRGEDQIGNTIVSTRTLHSSFENGDVLSITKRWEPVRDYQTGQQIRGYQTPRYYLSWSSGSYPLARVDNYDLNCSLQTPAPVK